MTVLSGTEFFINRQDQNLAAMWRATLWNSGEGQGKRGRALVSSVISLLPKQFRNRRLNLWKYCFSITEQQLHKQCLLRIYINTKHIQSLFIHSSMHIVYYLTILEHKNGVAAKHRLRTCSFRKFHTGNDVTAIHRSKNGKKYVKYYMNINLVQQTESIKKS